MAISPATHRREDARIAHTAPEQSRILKWLAPDAAWIVSAIAVLYGIFLGDGIGRLFRDSDTGWHIRSGETALRLWSLPRTDSYSFSKPGETWFAWEWGADVLMGAAHQWDGLTAVALLYLALLAVTTWVWFQLHWLYGGNFFLACALASPMLSTLSLHWLARPHVFGWLMTLLALLGFEKAPQRFRIGHAAALAAFGAVWANLHASFFFLPALAVLFLAGELLRAYLWGEEARRARWYALAALSSAAGTLINPYGLALHGHVWTYLNNRELLARVGEFQSFNFHAEGATQVLLVVAIAIAGGTLALAERRPHHFLLCLGLALLSLRSARALPLLALLALAPANAAITAAFRRAHLGPRMKALLDCFLAYSERLRIIDARCGGYAVAPVGLLLMAALMNTPAIASQAAFPAKEFPVAAAKALDKLPAGTRLLAPDKYGGYLIYRFEGKRKVFMDGRSDFYGVEFMKQYIRLIEARPGWREQVHKFQFTHALLPNNYSLLAGLEHWGWKQIYRDEVATLLARN